jgi:hypothetical protein
MPQEKVSIRDDEWEMVKKHYQKHREQYRKKGIYSATALVRQWIHDKIVELDTDSE